MSDLSAGFSAKPKLFLWTENLTFLNRLPSRYPLGRRRAKSKSKILAPGAVDITSLQTSFNLWDGIRELQKRPWRFSDLQYLVLAMFAFFSLSITPSAPMLKFMVIVGTSWVLLMPATRQFFLPSMPIWIYLLYFFSSRFIATEYRPHIWVRVLPALENVLYGANLSNILSAHQHVVLDLLAWFPYGIGHFGAPAVCSLVMFIFAAPSTLPIFTRCFGWMALIGVTIQLVFPCTAPWYENEHGLVPAAYGMPGSPAGLARIDQIFGIDLYTTNFTTAPVPFGAFPSLHAANAVLEALFMSHCFPQFRTLFIIYAGWMSWATMYLSHHYAIDLVAGGLIAASFFYAARARWLPQRQADKMLRWEYEFIEIGDRHRAADEELGGYFGVAFEHRRKTSNDSWTLASSDNMSSSSGTLSPTLSDGAIPAVLLGDMGKGHSWDGMVGPREVDLKEVVVAR